jgi:hypothetical protein
VAEGPVEASAAALCAGLDVELPTSECFAAGLGAALDAGLVAPDVLDTAVLRVLRLKFELGVFEQPYADEESRLLAPLDAPAARALAREVAEQSIVLLANDGVLPLATGQRVAVLGPNADDPLALFGNYSFQNHVASHFPQQPLERTPTLLDALRERLGGARVTHVRGCGILRAPGQLDDERGGIAAAAEAARGADVAVLVVGDKAGHFRTGTVGEGTDTWDLSLPGVQPELVEAVLATGTPTVLVLVNGRPFDLSGVAERAAAIVEAWFPGQDGAAAVADVLTGAINPSGKTSVTFARGAGVMPCHHDHKALAAGIPPLPTFAPVFPFGHGLSYTRFDYSDLELGSETVATDGALTVSCRVRNAGERAGREIVQLYLGDPVASVTRPVRELRGFVRVPLEAGAGARLTFRIPADLFAFTGPDLVRIVEPGRIEVQIAASSADIRLRASCTVAGPTRRVGEDRAFLAGVTVEAE